MSGLSSILQASRLADRVFDERQLSEVIGGSEARRYALVNRAIKDGSLIRLKRGNYLLGSPYCSQMADPYAIAQALLPGSYVSFETALAYHGWIPEAVHTIASVTPSRKSVSYETPGMGRFTYHPIAIHEFQFLVGVERQKFGTLTAFVASPLRALLDLVALRKQQWTDLNWLTVGMRVDEEHLLTIKRKEFVALKSVYKHKMVNAFLRSLELAVLPPRNRASGAGR